MWAHTEGGKVLTSTTGALRATKRAGLQPAMDHILENADKPVPEVGDEDVEEPVPEGAEAKSIKCSECGKVFRSQATAGFHAERTGHEEFEESTEEVSIASPQVRKEFTDVCWLSPIDDARQTVHNER